MPLKTKIPIGINIIIAFFILNAILWTVGQGGAVIAYDRVAGWGFQDPREALDPAIVEVNRGIGLTDMIIQIPLYLIAAVGLLQLRFYGAVAAWLVLGTTLYWPVVFWSSQYFYGTEGIKHNETTMSTHVILIVILLFALWAIIYLYRNRQLFTR
ncbi:hypothetical protein CEE37_04275 [candidate division LCP-89 bacterium B3_LCP]|uniref:DUF2127 domain-containing protein n=1 Tax=candidate division LCP-89 bacterium B3_LCP TaxID=2012998 RepID=A0A532V3U9_UNCL8|nr:MAG: hypothetical protein CEE37_04275 [candidate division LCP-89 bacterium B3_LCP]